MIDENSGYFDGSESVNRILSLASESYIVGERFYVSSRGYTELYYARRSGRLFILKSLRKEFREDAVAIAALRKEYELGFRLDVPGIVKTFDMVSIPQTGLSIVLEHCRGDNLRRLMDAGLTIDGPTLIKISRSLADIIENMHQAGVIHRDIKPSNIVYDAASGNVRLIDFGCADAFDHTLFKGKEGTNLYKSPQFTNTPAEDWYALSLTLKELASHCKEKKASCRVAKECGFMKKGVAPNFNDSPKEKNTRALIAATIAILLTLSGITFYIVYHKGKNAYNEEKNHETLYNANNAKTDAVKDNGLHVPQDKTIPSSVSYPPQSITKSFHAEEKTNTSNASPSKSDTNENVKSLHDEEEVFRTSKNHVKPEDDISELNFNSVNGKTDPLAKKAKECGWQVYMAAEHRKMKIYKTVNKLDASRRDSIDRLVYDEKENCEAILKEMGDLPPDTDMERVKRLVRQSYLTFFPRLNHN